MMFLTADDLVILTGRKRRALQIQALRSMGIPFRVNAAGRPVVCRSAVEGVAGGQQMADAWQPRVLKAA